MNRLQVKFQSWFLARAIHSSLVNCATMVVSMPVASIAHGKANKDSSDGLDRPEQKKWIKQRHQVSVQELNKIHF